VHVLVGRAHCGSIGELISDAIQTFEELSFFAGVQNACAAERMHPRFTRGDVLRPETVIDGKAAV